MKRIGYFNGRIDDLENMTIPMCDRSVFYGDAVYDAVLVLNGKPFAWDLHLDRLYRSCAMTEIEFTMERDALTREAEKLFQYFPQGETMLYLQVTRGSAPRKHEYPENTSPNLLMFIQPITVSPKDKRASLKSIEDMRFEYCNIKTTNLMPNVFAAQKATAAGATEALLHRGDRVTEAAHSSILMIDKGVLTVPPLDRFILPGITRAVLTDLCIRNSIPVETRIFTVDELKNSEEIILCSTTKNILFVYEIDGERVGGRNRELAQKLQDLFLEEVFKQTGVRL